MLQLCPTLCDPIDSSPPDTAVPGILRARTLEWVTFSFSSAWKWKGKVKSLSHVRLFATPWTAAYQAPPSMGFSRQEYWSGLPLPSLVYVLILINMSDYILTPVGEQVWEFFLLRCLLVMYFYWEKKKIEQVRMKSMWKYA